MEGFHKDLQMNHHQWISYLGFVFEKNSCTWDEEKPNAGGT